MDRLSRNTELQSRKEQATARGVGVMMQVFAARAENAEIFDVEGKRYLDFAGGIGVLNTGHRHPRVMAAVTAQLQQFTHTCWQVMPYPGYVELAEKMNRLTPGAFAKKTAFFSTGAEAIENSIKIARVATGRSGVIAFSGAFHGRTMLAMTLTGKVAPYKAGFGPLPPEIFHAPFPIELHGTSVDDALKGIERLFKADIDPARVAAIIIEPVQGEGGFYVAPPELLRALRGLCDEYGMLLIVDEVQSGFARTGRWFAIEHAGVEPDIIVTAKSLAGGFPLSAVTGRAEVMDAAAPGGLGGTYAGNPVAIAAAPCHGKGFRRAAEKTSPDVSIRRGLVRRDGGGREGFPARMRENQKTRRSHEVHDDGQVEGGADAAPEADGRDREARRAGRRGRDDGPLRRALSLRGRRPRERVGRRAEGPRRTVHRGEGGHRRIRDLRVQVEGGGDRGGEALHGAEPEALAGLGGRVRGAADVESGRGLSAGRGLSVHGALEEAVMTITRHGSTSRARLWTSRTLAGAAVLFLVFDAAIKLAVIPPVVDAFAKLGIPVALAQGIGVLELFCVALFLFPATAALGAVLLTGFLGGAIAIHVRVGDPLLSHVLFPVYVGALLWAALFLRDERIRALVGAEAR